MSTIQELFQQAQLAEAAYTDLGTSIGSQSILSIALDVANKDLYNGSFSATQATAFAKQWRVVDQYTASSFGGLIGSGFSATVFQDLSTGQYVFAVRGTEPEKANDLQADAFGIGAQGIALRQALDLYNYRKSLNTAAGQSYQAAYLKTDISETTALNALWLAAKISPAGQAAYDLYKTTLESQGFWVEGSVVSKLALGDSSAVASTGLETGRNIQTGSDYDVVGHSLGGHLAMVLGRLDYSNVASVETFNPPFFDPFIGDKRSEQFFTQLQQLDASVGSSFKVSQSYEVAGDLVHLIGDRKPSMPTSIFTESENTNLVSAHLMTAITDALAVYTLLAKLDPSLDTSTGLNAIAEILKVSSGIANNSLEAALAALGKLYGKTYDAIETNRDDLYKHLKELQTAITGTGTVFSLVSKSITDLVSLATDGENALAYRYALKAGNPFAVLGVDYQTLHNSAGELDRYDSTTGKGELTDQYLADRAEMLAWKLKLNADDTTSSLTKPYGQDWMNRQQYFKDAATGEVIVIGNPSGGQSERKQYFFGDEGSDTFFGNAADDHLYGGAGMDRLDGDKGNDYLEGNAGSDILSGGEGNDTLNGGTGNDTYKFTSGDGWDTITDQDGIGHIEYDGITLTGGKAVGDSGMVWQEEVGGKTFTYILSDWTEEGKTIKRLSILGPDGGLWVKGWSAGQLGITLQGQPTEPTGGLPSNNKLVGDGLADDVLSSGEGNDMLFGRGGDDRLYGGTGNDLLNGGAGHDTLLGGAGNDVVLFGNLLDLNSPKWSSIADNWTWSRGEIGYIGDSDRLTMTMSVNSIPGEVFFSDAYGSYTDGDVIFGGAGDDLISGSDGADLISGDADNDWVHANGGDDTVLGGTGDDQLLGDDGADYLDGGSGTDRLIGGYEADILLGGDGNDILIGDLASQPGSNLPPASANLVRYGEDTLYGGAGTDELLGGGKNDYLDGGDGNDELYGGAQDDELHGGAGNDRLEGDQEGIPASEHGADSLFGDAGNDTLIGGGKNDKLNGGDDNDILDGGLGNDLLQGDAGDDTLLGGAGNDTLDGGSGKDTLYGEAGNDTLIASGTGDGLVGGAGDDTYVINSDGAVILDNEGNNHIVLTGLSNIDSLSVSTFVASDGSDHMALFYGPKDSPSWVLLQDGFAGALPTVTAADGSSLNGASLLARLDKLDLSTSPGGGQLNGGTQDDTLHGNVSNDILNGGEGRDKLVGGGGNDTLVGGGGSDELEGGDGDDTLTLDAGADLADGGIGRDTYILEDGAYGGVIRDPDGGGSLRFGAGFALTDIVTQDIGDGSLLVRYGANEVRIENGNGIESVALADGAPMSLADFLAATRADSLRWNGTDSDDRLVSLGGNDEVYGGAGNDRLTSQGGNDTLYGGGGVDHLDGGNGNDVFDGGDGDDRLLGGSGEDTFLFYRGAGHDVAVETLTTTYDGTPLKNAEKSTLRLVGGLTLADVTCEAVGDSFLLRIKDSDDSFLVSQGVDNWWLQVGEEPAQLMSEWLTESGFMNPSTLSESDWLASKKEVFRQGLTWDSAYIGFPFSEVIVDQWRDEFFLKNSNEASIVLDTASSKAILWQDIQTVTQWVAAETSTVETTAGSRFVPLSLANSQNGFVSLPPGAVTVTRTEYKAGESGSGGARETVIGYYVPDSQGNLQPSTFLVTKYTEVSHTVTVDHYTITNAIDVLSAGDADNAINTYGRDIVDAGGGDDSIIANDGEWPGYIYEGKAHGVFVNGGAGNDQIVGSSDQDFLAGGHGSDTLEGGAGSDVYFYYGAEDGWDTISDSGQKPDYLWCYGGDVDEIDFGPQVSLIDVVSFVETTGAGRDELVIRVGDDAGLRVALADPLTDEKKNGFGIERFRMSDGSVYSLDDFMTLTLQTNTTPIVATELNDQSASEGESFSFTLPVDAFVDPDSGDVLAFSATLANGDPLPTWLTFDAATGTLSGTPSGSDAGSLSLKVIATDQAGASASQDFVLTVSAAAGVTLTGTASGETLTGGAGNDTLTGGAGSDTLQGGAGNDTFLIAGTDAGSDRFEGGDGFDVVLGSTGDDTIRLQTYGGEAAVERIDGGGGYDIIAGSPYGTTLDFSTTELVGIAAIHGGAQADTVIGSSANDLIVGGGGSDKLYGGAGDDTFLISGTDVGIDRFEGGDGVDVVLGSTGDDTIRMQYHTGTATVERIDGGGGYDIITGTQYGDTLDFSNTELIGIAAIHGGAAADTLIGSSANDLIVGGGGSDKLYGGAGDDTFLIEGADAGSDRFEGGDGFDIVLGSSGDDTLRLQTYGGSATVERIDGGGGYDVIAGWQYGAALDFSTTELIGIAAIQGGDQADTITGGVGDDFILGGLGNDRLNGVGGIDVLQGGDGNDVIGDQFGNSLFDGGSGTDTLTGGTSAELYLGGTGNDTLTTGAGNDIVLFNQGDGQDTFAAGGSGSDTVSLGGNLAYSDLSFAKSANDLVLKMGTADQITFKDWYATTPSKPVVNLQVIAEAMTGFEAGGSDPLLDQRVETFDFAGLAGAFDAARTADTTLTTWALTNALLDFQLAGSDSEALGGDLAYQYGKNGTLAGIGLTAAQEVIGAANFGSQAQALRPPESLQTGAVRLA